MSRVDAGCECTGDACEWCWDMEREARRLAECPPARASLDDLARRLAWLHGHDPIAVVRQVEDRAAECADAEELDALLSGLAALVRDGEARELATVLTEADIAF